MILTSEEVERIKSDALKEGFGISQEELNIFLLARMYHDKEYAVEDWESFSRQRKIIWLDTYIKRMASEIDTENPELTFEENRQAMADLIQETKARLANGEIDAKDALKIEADLRVKLNDKFKVQDDTRDKVVIVETKYNTVCRFGHECYMPTRNELMEMYDLVPRNQNEDI